MSSRRHLSWAWTAAAPDKLSDDRVVSPEAQEAEEPHLWSCHWWTDPSCDPVTWLSSAPFLDSELGVHSGLSTVLIALHYELLLVVLPRAVRSFAPEWPFRQCHGLCPASLLTVFFFSWSIIFETKAAHDEVGSGSKIPFVRMPFYTIKQVNLKHQTMIYKTSRSVQWRRLIRATSSPDFSYFNS